MRKAAEIQEAFADRTELDGKTSFFLVGIGGAGMSALARMLKHRGHRVAGTDSTRSSQTEWLTREGIEVSIGHSGEGIRAEDAVVLTDAIDLANSPEVKKAKELNAPIFRRSQALGWLLRDRKVIAVTGTHGKTTTTGMIGAGLIAAGLDPLVVVGAAIPQWCGPVVEGKGEWAVVEACEAYDAFHDIDPNVVVLTNLELDHVDYHGTWENLKRSVSRFVASLPADGVLVYCDEDSGAREIAAGFPGQKRAYSGVKYDEPLHPSTERKWSDYLKSPGRHNWVNANGAMAAISCTGANMKAALDDGIVLFRGAERRLQVLLNGPVTVVDDYAHHPTEIEASLNALRDKYPGRRLVVAYQPHLYSRTEPLIQEFADALSLADVVVLTDIYPAREDPIPGVSSARIAELVNKPVLYVPNRHLLPIKVAKMVREGDVVVGMGAGNIAEFAPAFVKEIFRRRTSTLAPPPHEAQSSSAGEGLNIAVVYGGNSAEREVSILSGRSVAEALQIRGHKVELIDVHALLAHSGNLARFTGADRPDLVFLAVHGTHAEDGAIQGLCELLHIPYTGSGIQASAVAMDKELTKKLLREAGIRVPEGVLLTRGSSPELPSAPVIVKPNAQGSTVGLTFVTSDEELSSAIEKALQYDSSCLVEEWITGMEISVPVLGDRALPPVEIAPVSGKYDFASKYTPGATEEIVPARLPEEILEQAKDIALRAHRALRCEGATRTDMIVKPGSGAGSGAEIFALEVNTLPGMTATSLLPNSAGAAGISFEDLCQWLVEDALRRYAKA